MANSTADDLLAQHVRTALSRRSSWINGPLSVVHSSYKVALGRYEKVLAKQKAVDDLKTDIGMLVLFVAGGALVVAAPSATVIFGGAGAGALARMRGMASSVLGRDGVQLVQLFQGHAVTNYIWSTLSKDTSTFLKRQAVSQAKAFSDGLGDAVLTDPNPDRVESIVRGHIDRIYIHIQECLEAVIRSDVSEEAKMVFAAQVGRSPFLQPVASLEGYRATIERRFELLLWMSLMLDMDRSVSVSYGDGGPQPILRSRPISTRPSDPSYSRAMVTHDSPGATVLSHINELYAAEHPTGDRRGERFIRMLGPLANVNHATLLKADAEAERLVGLTRLRTLAPVLGVGGARSLRG